MKDQFDLVVVGAGPGGLAAAATAVEAGMRVCLVDDNPACGGQIWRGAVGNEVSSGPASRWLTRIDRHAEMRTGWRVVAAPVAQTLRVEHEGDAQDIRYSALVLATGARELFLPFPGWTLPGVCGAGGLQAFVKSGFDIAGKRVVIAGTGPLLLAVAAGLHKAAARVEAIVEQAPFSRLARFGFRLLGGHAGKLAEGAEYGWITRGTRYNWGAWVSEAAGHGRVEQVTITSRSDKRTIKTDMLAVGFHLVANTELADLLNCRIDDGLVQVDALQETSVKGVYAVGEVTGIGGVDKALIEGQIAAFAASGQPRKAEALMRSRSREVRFALELEAAFALRDELRRLAREDTLVCRCEDVPHGELHVRRSWREAKLHTRCGMGPCQGRICGPATRFLYGWNSPQPRPPLFPADVATLIGPVADEIEEDATTKAEK